MEAVKQGAATVGLKSKTHAILVALKVLVLFLALSAVVTWLEITNAVGPPNPSLPFSTKYVCLFYINMSI